MNPAILVSNVVPGIAGSTADPVRYLDELQKQSVEGIARSANANVKPSHFRRFQDAAAGIVVQAVEGAKAVLIPTPPPSRLQ